MTHLATTALRVADSIPAHNTYLYRQNLFRIWVFVHENYIFVIAPTIQDSIRVRGNVFFIKYTNIRRQNLPSQSTDISLRHGDFDPLRKCMKRD